MKNRIKDFDSDEIPDDPDELLKILSEMLGGIMNNKLFDTSKDAEEMKLYEEELKKVTKQFPVKICENCGNAYYIIEENKKIRTFHPSGLACHWCNVDIYYSYYYHMRNARANIMGTFAEKDILN